MTPFIEHLRNRGLNNRIPFDIDYEQEIVSFPLFTPYGIRAGYQNYRWKCDKTKNNDEEHGRYFSWVCERHRYSGFFGTETLDRPGPLFIVEGIWDAISIINCGYACLAVLGSTPSPAMVDYVTRGCGKTASKFRVGILDGDDSYSTLKRLVHKSFTTKPFKDINECPRMYTASFIYRRLANVIW